MAPPSGPDTSSGPDRAPARDGTGRRDPASQLPSVLARVVAFSSIVIGGVAGALIGYAFADLGGFGGTAKGVIALISAVVGAGGVAVVAVLTLRAFGEWETIRSDAETPSGRAPARRRDRAS